MKRQYLGPMAAVLSLLVVLGSVHADPGGRVIYGDPKDAKKHGSVTLAAVFNATSAYQQIKRDKIDPDSARYLVLLKKANNQIQIACAILNERSGYDLIAENSFYAEGEKVDDVTPQLIKIIRKL